MKKTLLLFLLFSFLPFCLTAQEGKWVETEGDCFITNITPEEAFVKALTKAELKALEEAVGTHIKSKFGADAGICMPAFKNVEAKIIEW